MNDLQQEASDPDYSVWVSASAGTGKTKILTDRVLKLLIKGAEFKKILCLTYTNAAASEMQSRINYKLAKWAETPRDDLKKELELMFGNVPNAQEIEYAKSLYLKLLNSQDKINIHTIHSFCKQILKRFPFEANLNPGFQILDDIKSREILRKIRTEIYIDSEYDDITNFFLMNFHEMTINEILDEIIQHKLKFKKLFIKNSLNSSLIEDFVLKQNLQNPAELIAKSKELQNHQEILEKINSNILSFFLTKEGKKKQRLLSKKLALDNPSLLPELEYLQNQVFLFDQLNKFEKMISYSGLLVKLSQIFIKKYEKHKNTNSLLDYDDLIYFTKILLKNSDSRAWVLYKLDGGIDHLLVDEAQDTNIEQWEIIEAIIEEFYSGEAASNKNRTIFVVGDEKQSIFSFQGANLYYFNLFNNNIRSKLRDANKDFKIVNLEWSYRSTEEILDVVYNVFEKIKISAPELFISANPKILSSRNTHKGIVELWPLIKGCNEPELFWNIPTNNNLVSTEEQLAIKIASFIKNYIGKKIILQSTGKKATEGDFMILVRKRDKFTLEIINQLKTHSLNVAGIDRMILSDNLSIMDLIATAKFVLSPEDDLNLATLLKSPIIGLNEGELYSIALSRGKNSIWKLICNSYEENRSYDHTHDILTRLMQLYKVTNVEEFFSRVIDCLGLREILIEFNGFDSNDAINEFLYLVSSYSNMIDSSLQNFIYWFENNEIEIKRDVESSNRIRVMTVHGSKGLQAPVVILCDTTSIPVNKDRFIWTKDGDILSSMKSTINPKFFNDLKEKESISDMQEYLRLLYVAMTRAEDHLVICGYSNKNNLPENCWYNFVSNVIGDNYTNTFYDKMENPIDYDINFDKKKTWHPDKNIILKILGNISKTTNAVSPLIERPIHLEYGLIFHKILEDAMKSENIYNLKTHPLIDTLPVKLQNKLHRNIDNLLQNEEFLDLISREIKTELNLGIDQISGIKIGRIDLLAINDEEIVVIDYKSDTNPAISKELIPVNYIDQLNFYNHMIEKLYPTKRIICKILWLETGDFMNI